MMGSLTNNRNLSKILVQSDQHSPLCVGVRKDRLVPRILGPFANPGDIVARRSHYVDDATPHASVQEHSHQWLSLAIVNGSTRSLPTNRRA